jgi:hypothetical protein
MEGYPNLNNIAGGQYDWKLKQFAAAAQRDGRRISVRFLHGTFFHTCASAMRQRVLHCACVMRNTPYQQAANTNYTLLLCLLCLHLLILALLLRLNRVQR